MIIKLSDATPEAKAAWEKYYKEVMLTGAMGFKYLEPTADFDENGLKFPVDYLNDIGANVIFLPLEHMVTYADIVTSTAVDKNDQAFLFHKIIDVDFDIEKDYENLNATSIGNMAYVALYSKNKVAAKIANDILDKIYVKQKGIFLTVLNELM